MGGYTDMPTTTDSSVQSIEKNDNGDSFLHLTAYKYGEEYRTVKSVTTSDIMTFKYGYVEMRAKFPTGKGVWPSLWLKSVPQNGNYFAEVDIAEIMGKENVNSKEFIEQMAREKLEMYYPNEKVYVDKGM